MYISAVFAPYVRASSSFCSSVEKAGSPCPTHQVRNWVRVSSSFDSTDFPSDFDFSKVARSLWSVVSSNAGGSLPDFLASSAMVLYSARVTKVTGTWTALSSTTRPTSRVPPVPSVSTRGSFSAGALS